MSHPHSSVVTRFNPQRHAIYTMLLNTAGREWTIATLTASLRGSVAPHSVRTTLYALHTHGLLTRVPGRQAITCRLTDEGATAIAGIIDLWRRCQGPATIGVPRPRRTAPPSTSAS
jgi:hypothetical protein